MKAELLASKHLAYFPSASSIEFYNDKLYVIGDDATYLLVLDKDHNSLDSLQLFMNTSKRIAKDFKEDLEASARIIYNGDDHLLVFGSGATEAREKLYLFPLDSLSAYRSFSLKEFYTRLRSQGVTEVNIEGATAIKDKLIIGNRANLSTKVNQLIITDVTLFENPGSAFHIINLQLPASFAHIGISGLTYVPSSDLLLFTASEEETFSAAADGAIGNSYVGLIKNVSTKLSSNKIKVEDIIPLNTVSASLKKKKIESIAVEVAANNNYIIHLAADDDNGESTLYKLSIQSTNK